MRQATRGRIQTHRLGIHPLGCRARASEALRELREKRLRAERGSVAMPAGFAHNQQSKEVDRMCMTPDPAYRELLLALRTNLRIEVAKLEELAWEHVVRRQLPRVWDVGGGSSFFWRTSTARELRKLLGDLIRHTGEKLCEIEAALESVEELGDTAYPPDNQHASAPERA